MPEKKNTLSSDKVPAADTAFCTAEKTSRIPNTERLYLPKSTYKIRHFLICLDKRFLHGLCIIFEKFVVLFFVHGFYVRVLFHASNVVECFRVVFIAQ